MDIATVPQLKPEDIFTVSDDMPDEDRAGWSAERAATQPVQRKPRR